MTSSRPNLEIISIFTWNYSYHIFSLFSCDCVKLHYYAVNSLEVTSIWMRLSKAFCEKKYISKEYHILIDYCQIESWIHFYTLEIKELLKQWTALSEDSEIGQQGYGNGFSECERNHLYWLLMKKTTNRWRISGIIIGSAGKRN